jgi:hypothetical protein
MPLNCSTSPSGGCASASRIRVVLRSIATSLPARRRADAVPGGFLSGSNGFSDAVLNFRHLPATQFLCDGLPAFAAFGHLENRVSARIAECASIAAGSRTGQFAHFCVVTPIRFACDNRASPQPLPGFGIFPVFPEPGKGEWASRLSWRSRTAASV